MIESIDTRLSNKIKTREELKKILRKKNKKVILCHGCFDIVHPGHIRHLKYAKSKAEILIVSLTTDKFIAKGNFRPHIPENLRAENLASLEIVDYVILDNNKKPLNLIKFLKPNFFAKGFEYSKNDLPPATKEELRLVKSYGGNMIFTPGNVIYSSSELLKLNRPKILNERLIALMKIAKINFNDLLKTIHNFKKIKIHIIGDTIIDTFTETYMIGGQTKTPTISVLYKDKTNYLGGASIVAKHLSSAGSKVEFTTVIGDDLLGKKVAKELKELKIKSNLIIDKLRPTTEKNAIIANKYRLLKIDTVNNDPISLDIQKKIENFIKKSKSQNLIFSDFRHGIFNSNSISKFSSVSKKYKFRAADSQVASRWGNITDFKNFNLIIPNEREARFSLGDQDSTVRDLVLKLYDKTKTKNIILKMGNKGIFSFLGSKNKKNDFAFSTDSFTNNAIDPVGAGDALLAYSTLSLIASKSLTISSIIGSIAAACECEKDGNIPITSQEVIARIEQIQKNTKYIIE